MGLATSAGMKLARQLVRNPLMPDFFGPVITRAAIEQRQSEVSRLLPRLACSRTCYEVAVAVAFFFSIISGLGLSLVVAPGDYPGPVNPGLSFAAWLAVCIACLSACRLSHNREAELATIISQLSSEIDALQSIEMADCPRMNQACQVSPEGLLFRFRVIQEARPFTKGELAMMLDWAAAVGQRKAYGELYGGASLP